MVIIKILSFNMKCFVTFINNLSGELEYMRLIWSKIMQLSMNIFVFINIKCIIIK